MYSVLVGGVYDIFKPTHWPLFTFADEPATMQGIHTYTVRISSEYKRCLEVEYEELLQP